MVFCDIIALSIERGCVSRSLWMVLNSEEDSASW